MRIHQEGFKPIAIAIILFGIINIFSFYFLSDKHTILSWVILILTFISVLFVISFFRTPNRTMNISHHQIISPADGKVVALEEVTDPEYFREKRLQLSIFMGIGNVHLNRVPMSGEIMYSHHFDGKYLVAWHPKSSTENEHHSVVIKNQNTEILVKQIAGAVAKRIVNYMKVGMEVKQGNELGFIKFGSRVDLLLPLNTKIEVQLNQKVKGGKTVLATIEEGGRKL